jgi:hypothetical protein
MQYHLAELNIARLRAPLDDPMIADFVAGLDRINALAEAAPGFVWRLISDDGSDATSIRTFPDESIIVNFSVWTSVDALFNYAYYSDHTEFFRRRAEWFEKMETPSFVMWWIPAEHTSTLDEAKAKLELLTAKGATPLAFTFKQRFTADEMLAYEPK